jgi:hypothetical protein
MEVDKQLMMVANGMSMIMFKMTMMITMTGV